MIISNNTSIYGSVDVDSVSASVFEVNKTANVTVSAGQIAWNASDATFDMGMENGVTLQVGQELHVYGRNFTSTTIPNGKAVYIISATGLNGHLYFQTADNTNTAGVKVIAITTQAIAGDSLGYATSFGVVRDLNTSNLIEGVPFYLGTSGNLTSTRPSWPDHSIRLGYCVNVHPTSGEIYVNIHQEQAIEEIYDVVITSATQGDSFIFENNKWINRNFGDITKDSTGFKNPESVIVTYDETTRKVTLTGLVDAYWRSNNVSALVPGWVSDAHPAEVSATQFLYYNGSSFVWSSVPWTFDMLQIAAVIFGQDGKYYFTLRETHGLMQHQVHQEFHLNIGTYLISGGDISSFVLNSTTVADRRPDVASMKLGDEDLETVLSSLTSKSYTLFNLSGATRGVLTSGSAEIIPVSTNRPYYNQLVGSVWQQTLMPNNDYAAIFVMAVPAGSDTKSQNRRFLFIQPQTSNASLSTIQALLPSSLNLNDLTYSPEYNFFGKIIIRYTGGNWVLISVEKLSTSKAFSSSTGGGYLSTVAIGAALSGNGTAGSPLNLIDSKTPGTYTKVVTNEYGIVTSGGSLTTSDVSDFAIVKNPTTFQTISMAGGTYLLLSGNTASDGALVTRTSAFNGTASNFAMFTDGNMSWGPGNTNRDTNLYRSTSGVLKTDTDFVARNISATTLTVGTIDNTEISYLNGTSANVQNQLSTLSATSLKYNNGANNRLATFSDSSTITGESNLTFDGAELSILAAQARLNLDGNLANNPGIRYKISGTSHWFVGFATTASPNFSVFDYSTSNPDILITSGASGLVTIGSTTKKLNLPSLTASTVVITDGSKNLTSSPTTSTQIGYLSSTTSNVQTQLNAKNAEIDSVINQTFYNYNLDFPENYSLRSTVGSVSVTSGTTPFGTAYYNLINTRHKNGESDGLSGYGGQLAWGMTNYQNRMAFRTRNFGGTGWQSWNELWSTANLPVSSVNNYTNTYNLVNSTSANWIVKNPTADQTISGAFLRVQRNLSSDISYLAGVSGDAIASRFAIYADGKTEWGPGSALRDVNLYRSASGVLKTDTDFVARNISATTLTVGSIDNTEFGYLNGVTSNIQTQLNVKNNIANSVVNGDIFSTYNTDLPENTSLYSSVGSILPNAGTIPFGTLSATWFNLINSRHRNGASDGASGWGGQITWGQSGVQNRLAFRSRLASGSGWQPWYEVLTTNSPDLQTISGNAIRFERPATTSVALVASVSGDSANRFGIYADGQLQWGSGSAVRDTFLYRSTSGTLKTDGTMIASNFNVGANQIIGSRKTGWTSATGTPTKTTFDTTTVTTAQLAERVKALIDDLISHGIIGS